MQRALLWVSAVALVGASVASPSRSQVIDPPIARPIEASFTGVVQALPILSQDAAICAPPSFALGCSDGTLYITSSKLDLGLFAGQNVKLYGTSFLECPLFDIHTIESPPPATLTICGTGGFGCAVRLRSGPGELAQHWLFASLAPGLVPLSLEKGSFLLGPQFFLIGMGFSTSGGPGAAFDFSVPVAPALSGLRIYFQAARRELAISVPRAPPVHFSNATCIDISGFTLLCVEVDC